MTREWGMGPTLRQAAPGPSMRSMTMAELEAGVLPSALSLALPPTTMKVACL